MNIICSKYRLVRTVLMLPAFFSLTAFSQKPSVLWLKGYGGNRADNIATNVIKLSDGGFIVGVGSNSTAGQITDTFCNDYSSRIIFIKYNSNASIREWSKCFESSWSDTGYVAIIPATDGFILAGESNNGNRWLVHKEDSLGNIIWRKSYGGSVSQSLQGVITTDDGGFILCGTSYSSDGDVGFHYGSSTTNDIWILKLDSTGNKIWSRVIGGSQDESVYSIIPGNRGDFYIAGTTQSSDHDCTGYHAGGQDAYLARVDSSGNILWHDDLGGSGDDGYFGWGVGDGKGGVLLAFGSNSSDGDVHHHIGDYDYWILEVDSNKNILWDNCYGSAMGYEFPRSICKAADGSIWITGESSQSGGQVDTSYGSGDAWIVHADSTGHFLGARVLGSSSDDEGTMIYPLSNNTIVTGGLYTNGDGSFLSTGAFSTFPYFDGFLSILSPLDNTSVELLAENISVNIFPNPAHEQINVSGYSTLEKYRILITSVSGQQLYSGNYEPGASEHTIDVQAWPGGLYLVQMISDNGHRTIRKLIIE